MDRAPWLAAARLASTDAVAHHRPQGRCHSLSLRSHGRSLVDADRRSGEPRAKATERNLPRPSRRRRSAPQSSAWRETAATKGAAKTGAPLASREVLVKGADIWRPHASSATKPLSPGKSLASFLGPAPGPRSGSSRSRRKPAVADSNSPPLACRAPPRRLEFTPSPAERRPARADRDIASATLRPDASSKSPPSRQRRAPHPRDAPQTDPGTLRHPKTNLMRNNCTREQCSGKVFGMSRGENLQWLDAQLAGRAKVEGALRLRLGQLLEALSGGSAGAAATAPAPAAPAESRARARAPGGPSLAGGNPSCGPRSSARSAAGHFDLGFASLEAYARERCGLGRRWAQGARCLARRLEALPALRTALAHGHVSWSMAEIVARVATPETEAEWRAACRHHSVRQMRELVAAALAQGSTCRAEGGAQAPPRPRPAAAPPSAKVPASPGEASASVSCTVNQEDAWLFEATRALLDSLGTYGAGAQLEALLSEGQEELLRILPNQPWVELIDRVEDEERVQRGWWALRERWRQEAEARLEGRIATRQSKREEEGNTPQGSTGISEMAAQAENRWARLASRGLTALRSSTPRILDDAVAEVARELASNQLELSRGLQRFHLAEGWRRLGYATERQYARERLGLSCSSLRARRALARRLSRLPKVTRALAEGELGVEAAAQLARVATTATEESWLERARRRTVKHLQEEVSAALLATRISGEPHCPPPCEHELSELSRLERAVLAGSLRVSRSPGSVEMQALPGAGIPSIPSPGRHDAGVEPAHHGKSFGDAVPRRTCREEPTGHEAQVSLGEVAPPSHPFSTWASSPWQCAKGRPGAEEPPSRRAWGRTLWSLQRWLQGASQMSAQASAVSARSRRRTLASLGRVQLRFRVPRWVAQWWRGMREAARAHLPPGVSFLRYLCSCLWRGWQHVLGANMQYGGVYLRDRFRCSSPVCSRRDVTPHHVHFRSAGGGDEPGNLTSVCSACHLHGIHEGRIRVSGTASRLRWELGKEQPRLVIEGRERLAS